MLDKELETKILRFYCVKRRDVQTIAAQHNVHLSTVDPVRCQAGLPKAQRIQRASSFDAYLGFVIQGLEQRLNGK